MVCTAGRAGFAVLALLAVMRSRRSSPLLGITRTNIWVLAMAGSLLAVHWVTFFLAVTISGVAVATLGFDSFPAFITLCVCVFFKENISIGEWPLLLLVALGLVMVTPSFELPVVATIDLQSVV